MLLGAVACALASCPLRRLSPQVPPWDGTTAGQGVTRDPHFSLRVWNDGARFCADAQGLTDLLSGRSGRTGSSESPEDFLNEPALRKLAEQARAVETDLQTKRAADARKALVDRCKADLEAGLSTRRLRQKLEPRCFVLDFTDGDNPNVGEAAASFRGIKGQIQLLRDAVSFLLQVCTPFDEVVLRVTSPGGLVGDYGLASAQLSRLRQSGVRLVACVDVIAASGGYMLACVSEHLVASPFALLGSIGVVAGMPNVHRLLQRNEVDYLQFTAGRFKRTVNVLTENSEEGLAKFQEELDAVHSAFTAWVEEGRGSRIAGGAKSAATGEVFLGSEALSRGLVDEICTSDEYLRRCAAQGFVVIEVRPAVARRSWCQDSCLPLFEVARGAVTSSVATAVAAAGAWAAKGAVQQSLGGASGQGAAEWLLAAQVETQRPGMVV